MGYAANARLSPSLSPQSVIVEMIEYEPVSMLDELDTLLDDDIIAGYRDGLGDPIEPGHNRGRAYWHGWRVAQMDRGRMPTDSAHQKLVAAFVSRAKKSR